jgi:hypothetical protein
MSVCVQCGEPITAADSYAHRFQDKRIHIACFDALIDEQRGLFAVQQIMSNWDIDA